MSADREVLKPSRQPSEISNDPDPQETREWIEALEGIVRQVGRDRAAHILKQFEWRARELGISLQSREANSAVPPHSIDCYRFRLAWVVCAVPCCNARLMNTCLNFTSIADEMAVF
jgi:hypothetical protein